MKINKVFEIMRKPIRCQNCDRLLLKAKLKPGCSIEIVCDRCKTVNLINLYDRIDNKINKCYNEEKQED